MYPWRLQRYRTLPTDPMTRIERRIMLGPRRIDWLAHHYLRVDLLSRPHQSPILLDEDKACTWLFDQRWPDGFTCDRCGGREVAKVPERPRVRRCAGCHHHHSVTAGTPLHGLRTPVRQVLYLLTLLGDLRYSAAEAARRACMRYHTVWEIQQKLRAGLSERLPKLGELAHYQVVLVSRRGTRLEPNPPRDWWGDTQKVAVAIVTDIAERFLTKTGSKPVSTARALVNEVANRPLEEVPESPEHKFPFAYRAVPWVLDTVHRSVTKRWMNRYLDAICSMRACELDPASWARVILDGPRRTARELTPSVPPNDWLYPDAATFDPRCSKGPPS